ncbi:hypothetical protein [Parapedobacter koreensis]|uniref:Uncharacterized protein n=1 Tax=Parapedobacter koreensis TaxID=332977 RepID=A0A1H7F3L1_9SPHI|nr:hypothetical protein [Parapedobacter koreensis]SEK17705.1 hypothetical protein SAMN05421740_10122 [Parapedobacter koreensis]
MAITSDQYPPAIIIRLKRQTRGLIKKQAIPLPQTEHKQFYIAGVIQIQQIRDYNEPEISASDPEGYRVLISQGKEVVQGLDFYFRGQRLFFLHAFSGAKLGEFVEALNAIEEKYRHKRGKQKICFVEFLHAEQTYLSVFTDLGLSFYTYRDHQLKKTSNAQIKKKLFKLQSNLQPLASIDKL